jgi:nicotinamide-nucleotide amidase
MRCIVISIGDELLGGQSVNTNSSYICSEMFEAGFPVERVVTIPDDRKIILSEFRRVWRSYDVIITTGGLGPTEDDVTRNCLSDFFNLPLISSRKLRLHIKDIYSRRGIIPAQTALSQSFIPRGSVILDNPLGTSAGILIRKEGKIFISLPGVPAEMKHIFKHDVLPYLTKLRKKTDYFITCKTFNTIGITESVLCEIISAERKNFPSHGDADVTIAYLPSLYEVKLRVTVKSKSKLVSRKLIDDVGRIIMSKIGSYVYSADGESVQEVIAKILTRNRYTLSVAESCTGGLISSAITDVPGSSKFFLGSVVAYSNDLKNSLLGVRKSTIKKYGAVSREVAEQMANGIRRATGSDIAVATTGIAGPTGATAEKPVGLVWIAFADRNNCYAEKFIFSKDRIKNKHMMSKAALNMIRKKLSDIL